MDINRFNYGPYTQNVICCKCFKIIGINYGCSNLGDSHELCSECKEEILKEAKNDKQN